MVLSHNSEPATIRVTCRIDDIGLSLLFIGGKVGIPAGAAVAVVGENADIVPKAAAKIKEAVLTREDAGLQEQLHRPREVAASDGGKVALDLWDGHLR